MILSLKARKGIGKGQHKQTQYKTEHCIQGLSASGIICEQLLLGSSMCGQALKRENVFKPRDICWRKGFCVIRVSAMFVNTEEWRKAVLFLQVISPAHKGKSTSPPRFCCSRTGEKPILSTAETPLGNWGK